MRKACCLVSPSYSLQFEGAYNMLKDMEEMNMTPTANMYNAIMAGYFREASCSLESFMMLHFASGL